MLFLFFFRYPRFFFFLSPSVIFTIFACSPRFFAMLIFSFDIFPHFLSAFLCLPAFAFLFFFTMDYLRPMPFVVLPPIFISSCLRAITRYCRFRSTVCLFIACHIMPPVLFLSPRVPPFPRFYAHFSAMKHTQTLFCHNSFSSVAPFFS